MDQRGSFLFAAETDRRRIGLEMLLRLVACAFAAGLLYWRESEMLLPTGAAFLIYILWPLLHMGDRMEFYRNGILCQGVFHPVGERTRTAWVGSRYRLSFLPTTCLEIGGRRIDVSFMEDAQKLFNRAYHGAIY